MNVYNPLDAMKRLEAAGLQRGHAEAIASEINESGRELVTKDYLTEQLETALAKQTIRLGGLVAAIVALATAVIGLLNAIK